MLSIVVDNAEELYYIIKHIDKNSSLAKLPLERFKLVYDFIDDNDLRINPYGCELDFKWVSFKDMLNEASDIELEVVTEDLIDDGLVNRDELGDIDKDNIEKYFKGHNINVISRKIMTFKYDVIFCDDENKRVFVYVWK